jgi:hypothetical protein
MDILARLKRLHTSLSDMTSDFRSSQNIKSPEELMPDEEETEVGGVPPTPPAEGDVPPEEELGAQERTEPEDINLGDEDLTIGDDDIPKIETTEETPVPDIPDEPPAEEEAPEVADIPEDPTETEEDPTEEEEKPKERNWEPITPPDNDMKSLSFKSDKEKIFLDMKRLDIAEGLWIARLYKDGKILDFGQILIPKNIKDPITYIMGLSNAMLDSRSMRYEQEWRAFYDEKRKALEEPGEVSGPDSPLAPEESTEDNSEGSESPLAPEEKGSPEESTEEKESEGMIDSLFDQDSVSEPGEEPEEEVDIGSLLD